MNFTHVIYGMSKSVKIERNFSHVVSENRCEMLTNINCIPSGHFDAILKLILCI